MGIRTRHVVTPHPSVPAVLRAQRDVYRQDRTPVVDDRGTVHPLDVRPADAATAGRHLAEVRSRFGAAGLDRSVRGLGATRGFDFAVRAVDRAPIGVQGTARRSLHGANVNDGDSENTIAGAGIGAAASHLDRSSASGPLPPAARSEFGAAFGDDLTDIRVHDDDSAHRAADLLSARAFTVGSDIYFAEGAFRPTTGAGERLLAHEVAHAVQQRGATRPRTVDLAVSEPADPAERDADRAAAELDRVRAVLGSAEAETRRADDELAAARERLAGDQRRLEEALGRLAAAEAEDPGDDEAAQLEAAARREEAQRGASAARAAETEARLALRSLEEQARALGARAASQERAAAAERRAREEAEQRARRRRAQARTAEAVHAAAEALLARVAGSVAAAEAARERAEAVRAGLDAELTDLRAGNDRLAARVAELTDSVHRDELARTQRRTRVEALEARSLEELGLTPDALVEHYGPHLPVPAATGAEDGAPGTDGQETLFAEEPGTAYVRAEQERRLRRAEKELAALGRVNPLALEEFAALEERHRFLAEQLEDLRRSRADLRAIIRDVDRHVEEVFGAAFADTAAQFEQVFATLFPGGEGRLRLTDPTDLLSTGIEVEARPAGKKVKRLSLLSGGERSLTAIALLVAIFRARPSPFYVMDEVEAALDDRNLGRLLTVLQQLRETSQLIVITHQKRTMEIADALYGVAMRGDGVTTVVGQRLAELR